MYIGKQKEKVNTSSPFTYMPTERALLKHRPTHHGQHEQCHGHRALSIPSYFPPRDPLVKQIPVRVSFLERVPPSCVEDTWYESETKAALCWGSSVCTVTAQCFYFRLQSFLHLFLGLPPLAPLAFLSPPGSPPPSSPDIYSMSHSATPS